MRRAAGESRRHEMRRELEQAVALAAGEAGEHAAAGEAADDDDEVEGL